MSSLSEETVDKERRQYAELFLTKINRLSYEDWQGFEGDCNRLLDSYLRPQRQQVAYTTGMI
jgi:hypothetical protein